MEEHRIEIQTGSLKQLKKGGTQGYPLEADKISTRENRMVLVDERKVKNLEIPSKWKLEQLTKGGTKRSPQTASN